MRKFDFKDNQWVEFLLLPEQAMEPAVCAYKNEIYVSCFKSSRRFRYARRDEYSSEESEIDEDFDDFEIYEEQVCLKYANAKKIVIGDDVNMK